jgi:small GTP-binding protein
MVNKNVKKFKAVFLGPSGCGKTSLIKRIKHGKFIRDLDPTIGIDFIFHTMVVKDEEIMFRVWDTAGQERFDSITKNYYQNSFALFLVFDLSVANNGDIGSILEEEIYIQTIKRWLMKIEQSNFEILYIIGNKLDCISNYNLNKIQSRIEKFLLENEFTLKHHKKIKLLFVSAKTNENVPRVFKHLSQYITDNNFLMHTIRLDTKLAILNETKTIDRQESDKSSNSNDSNISKICKCAIQ